MTHQPTRKKILVPLDGSELAEGAVDAALALAAQNAAELHLVAAVSVIPPVSMVLASNEAIVGWMEDQESKAGEYLEGIAGQAASRSPEVPVTTHVRVGNASAMVSEVAEQLGVDLLVLTTHGRGAFKRSWLGSVADQVVRQVEQPVLVLPHREQGLWTFDLASLRRVLVPLDGSDAAEGALDALSLVLPPGGAVRVTMANVVEERYLVPAVYIPTEMSQETVREQHRQQAEDYLQGVADRTKIQGVGVVDTVVLIDDKPGHALLQFCDEAGIHLVAMSTHGRGGTSRLFLGSVADKLIRAAPVPVLVTKRPREEA